jgi:hypothetical protein
MRGNDGVAPIPDARQVGLAPRSSTRSGRSTRRQTSDPADLQHPFGFCASLLSIKEIGLHRAFAFDHERTARLEAEHLAQGPSGRGGHVNTTGQAVAFHAPGGVYGISPDVVDEFMGAKHTGY